MKDVITPVPSDAEYEPFVSARDEAAYALVRERGHGILDRLPVYGSQMTTAARRTAAEWLESISVDLANLEMDELLVDPRTPETIRAFWTAQIALEADISKKS